MLQRKASFNDDAAISSGAATDNTDDSERVIERLVLSDSPDGREHIVPKRHFRAGSFSIPATDLISSPVI